MDELAEKFSELDPATQLRVLQSVPPRREWLRADLAPDVLVALLEHWPEPMHDHPSAPVRAASARFASDPLALLAGETDPRVQAALLARVDDPATVLGFLASPHWPVRAAAVRAAVRLDLREPLRHLALLSRHKDIKAACVEALRELGDRDWLTEQFL